MITKKISTAILAGLIAGGSYTVHADLPPAEQGSLGDTSQGKVGIEFQVGGDNGGDSILIQRLSNFDLGTFGAENSLSAEIDFCVYRTGSPNGFDFNMEVQSDNGAPAADLNGAFALVSASTGTGIGYSAVFNDKTGGSGTDYSLTQSNTNDLKATSLPSLSAATDGTFSCDGDNVSMEVKASFTDASVAKAADDYKDILTLIVSPI